jgi:hypothetical protein
MFVCFGCCALSDRGLCDELITRPEKTCRLWCVVVCYLETSWMRRPWPTGGCRTKNKQTKEFVVSLCHIRRRNSPRLHLHVLSDSRDVTSVRSLTTWGTRRGGIMACVWKYPHIAK